MVMGRAKYCTVVVRNVRAVVLSVCSRQLVVVYAKNI
jgi:hypothetical protein